ncbi:MAG: UpxY family transcription antiterminator [Bacteroidales bacterium]|jgi:transcription antitermination factor NusG|nr:UpxY family transcription antiterminator [Bacteroidales bacterium]
MTPESNQRSLQWWVLYTKPRAEKKAFEALNKQGYHVYLPCVTVVKQWSDRKKKVREPLFRSYLFIYCKENHIFLAAQDNTIVGIVRFEGRPAVVRDREIETIRRIEAGHEDIAVVDSTLVTGQEVLIKSGTLKGVFGILTEFRGTRRVAIQIESLGCNLLVEVSAGNITKLPSKTKKTYTG